MIKHLNLSPSSGICLTMSSLLKMGSRYSQVDWHCSQLSSMSCKVDGGKGAHGRIKGDTGEGTNPGKLNMSARRHNCTHAAQTHLQGLKDGLPVAGSLFERLDKGRCIHGLDFDDLVIQDHLDLIRAANYERSCGAGKRCQGGA